MCCEVRKLFKQKSVTVWFGKEIDIEDVRNTVRRLHMLGYNVRAPFYIGYNLSNDLVLNYLKNSLDNSDFLFILGKDGSLLQSIMEYAEENNKPMVGSDFKEICLVK